MSLTTLVSYAESDSEEEEKKATKKTTPRATDLPPLPSTFRDLYSTNARTSTSDDPNLHGGRKRAIPHVEGNWPSHVYLEWIPSPTESEQLNQLIMSLKEALENASKESKTPIPVPDLMPSLVSPLGAPLPLHISLSRTLQIKTYDRDAFLDILKTTLRESNVRAFDVRFQKLKWVPNFERNRWFLVLGIEKPPGDELNKLLEACNKASTRCGFPGLYTGGQGDGPMEENNSDRAAKRRKSSRPVNVYRQKGPCSTIASDYSDYFHVSIASNLVEPAPSSMKLAHSMEISESVKSLQVSFNSVKAKIGNTVHNIDLGRASTAGIGSGILGLA